MLKRLNMPGEHKNHQLVGFWCDLDFLAEIDRARGCMPRSQFIRDCLVDLLRTKQIYIPKEKTVAPDRAKKISNRYPEFRPQNISLNEDSVPYKTGKKK
ncbi:MAG: hypothetical protein M3Y82_06210 [Verrucomicrobiota bacterium]|nr:hypothetical protein [Verrucomicrobiota bacterium]